jgi:outer membrane lipoprotein-sorting protein
MAVQRARRSFGMPAASAHLPAIVLCVVVVLVASARAQQTPAPPAPPADQSFDRMYEQGQRKNAGMKTLTARFTETTTSTLLVQPLVARGTVLVERPSRVALRYTEPDGRVVVIDDRTLTSSWPSTRTIDISTALGRVQKQFIGGSAADLRREFEIDDSRALATPGVYHVVMTPKRRQIREALTSLDLWVDLDSLLLRTMRMTFTSGETKTMTFDDVQMNAPLPPDAFERPR